MATKKNVTLSKDEAAAKKAQYEKKKSSRTLSLIGTIIAIILISGVVWRLLTRDKKNPPTDAGHNGMPQPSAPLPYNPQDHMPAPVQGMGAPQGEPQQYYPQQQPPLSADYAQGQQWQGQQYPQQ